MKVWAKKAKKHVQYLSTFQIRRYQMLRQMPAFSAASSTTTTETSNYGGGITGLLL